MRGMTVILRIQCPIRLRGSFSDDSHTTQKYTQHRTWAVTVRKISVRDKPRPQIEELPSQTPTENPKRKASPHRSLVRLELRCQRRAISPLLYGDTEEVGLRLEHPVEDDRGHAQADR